MERNVRVYERMIPDKKGEESLFYTHVSLYKLIKKDIKDKIILDAGCGNGYGAYYWACEGAKKVIAVDISTEAITYAKEHYPIKNLKFSIMDVTKLGFYNESFQVVCSVAVIEHLKEYKKYLSEIHRVLKPNGVLTLATPNKKLSNGQNPHHIHEFEPNELYDLLRGYFKTVDVSGLQHSILLRLVSRIVPYKVIDFFRGTGLYNKVASNFVNLAKSKNIDKSSGIMAVCVK